MTTINDINDFIRILRENPEWKRAVQAEIAGEELLSVPQQLAAFIESTNENFRLSNEKTAKLETTLAAFIESTNENFRAANERITRLETTLAAFIESTNENFRAANERTAKLETTLAAFIESTNENFRAANERITRLETTLAAFIESTNENFRAANERITRLETTLAAFIESTNENFRAANERTAKLETTLAAFIESTNENFRLVNERQYRLETDMTEVKTDLADIKTEQQTMKSQIGNLLGDKYERQIGSMIKTVAQLLGTRNPKILKNIRTEMDQDFQQVIDAAEIRGAITETQANDIPPTDLIFTATRRDNGETIYPVIEISVTLDTNDIERARRRADSIAAAGMPTVAAVIGESISDPARQKAEAENVQVVLLEED